MSVGSELVYPEVAGRPGAGACVAAGPSASTRAAAGGRMRIAGLAQIVLVRPRRRPLPGGTGPGTTRTAMPASKGSFPAPMIRRQPLASNLFAPRRAALAGAPASRSPLVSPEQPLGKTVLWDFERRSNLFGCWNPVVHGRRSSSRSSL